jgi:hypothetical protein
VTQVLLRAVEHVHGHVGWLAALALGHPAILLRNPRRRAVGVVIAAAVLVTLAGACGAAIYPAYRTALKPDIFAASPFVGRLFERKEHLGVAAIVLAWVGTLLHLGAGDAPALDRPRLARAAWVAFCAAAGFAAATAALGLAVGAFQTF